jgi:flagellar biosynthesis protein FlhG
LGRGLEDISHLFLSANGQKGAARQNSSTPEEREKPASEERFPRVVAVTGDYRGLEKSFLVCNLAVELARRKRRVRVVDADPCFPDQPFLWGLRPADSLARLAEADDGHDLQVARHGPLGVQLLSLDVDMAQFAKLPEPGRRRLWNGLRAFEADAQLLLVDTPTYINSNSQLIYQKAHQIVVMVPSDPLGMTDAYRVVKSILSTRQKAPLGMVAYNVRMVAEAQAIAQQMTQTVSRFLDARIANLGYLYADANIEKSIIQGTPLLLTSIHSQAAKCLAHIAERIWAQHGARERHGVTSFFHSLSETLKDRP